MDNKTFVSRLAHNSGIDQSEAAEMLAALTKVITDKTADLDSIAIPGFGNFVSMKKQERIVTDPETGKRTLMPPHIKVEFVAGGMLKKRIK